MSFTVPALLPHPLPHAGCYVSCHKAKPLRATADTSMGLQHSCSPKGEHAGQNTNMLDVTKIVFNTRWKLVLSHPPNLLKLNWKSPKAITKWIISHIFWCGGGFSGGSSPRRDLEHIGMFDVRHSSRISFEAHNGGMILDTEWPLANWTGRDIKRLGQEAKWERGCSCTQPPYRNNSKHTHYVISQKSVFM